MKCSYRPRLCRFGYGDDGMARGGAPLDEPDQLLLLA